MNTSELGSAPVPEAPTPLDERVALLSRRHERLVADAPKMLRDPYRFGGRGSVLEADLARALLRERALRKLEAEQSPTAERTP